MSADTTGPRPPAPRGTRGQRTLRRLLDAGIDVFAARGYHAARVDDIVEVARASHGTFYLYFANKEALFAALVAEAADQLGDLTASLPERVDDPDRPDALRAWLARFADVYERYGTVMRTWEDVASELDPAAAGSELFTEVARGLGGLVEVGGTDLDRELAGLALVGVIERFTWFVQSGQVDAPRDLMLDTLTSVITDATGAREPRRAQPEPT